MTDDDTDGNPASDDAVPLGERFGAGVDGFRARFDLLERRLVAAADRSRVGTVERRVRSTIRASRIVRWLADEPAGDPIVVDLRDTRSLGPLLRASQRGLGRATPVLRAARESRVRTVANGFDDRLPAVAGVGLLGVVLWIAIAWETLSTLSTVAVVITAVTGLGLLALVRTRIAVENSTAVSVAVALLAPPADRTRR